MSAREEYHFLNIVVQYMGNGVSTQQRVEYDPLTRRFISKRTKQRPLFIDSTARKKMLQTWNEYNEEKDVKSPRGAGGAKGPSINKKTRK